jgi:hypothetical protein
VTTAAPALAARNQAACNKVLQKLPVQLGRLAPRVVHTTPDSPDVVAWGNPPVVLSCGVARPAALHPFSGAGVYSATGKAGPFFVVTSAGGDEIYTAIDRAVYVSIAVPAQYHSGPLPALARAIGAALPAVCSTEPTSPTAKKCTHRP